MQLTAKQIETIGECLRASAYGPFFQDGEFDSIFGLPRSKVAMVADQWPVVLDDAELTETAIHNSFNNLLGYPIKETNLSVWDEYISVSRFDLKEVFGAWRATR